MWPQQSDELLLPSSGQGRELHDNKKQFKKSNKCDFMKSSKSGSLLNITCAILIILFHNNVQLHIRHYVFLHYSTISFGMHTVLSYLKTRLKPSGLWIMYLSLTAWHLQIHFSFCVNQLILKFKYEIFCCKSAFRTCISMCKMNKGHLHYRR